MPRFGRGCTWWISALICTVAGTAFAGDDPLPAPRTIPQPTPVEVRTLPPFFRPSRLEVWQNYAVDRRGRFLPLVIAAPSGPYYYVSGKPYPYALLTSLVWLPFVAR